jgi:ribose-phosphate pyrophosphokinase
MPAAHPTDGVLFAIAGTQKLGSAVAAGLGWKLGEHEERRFADGEHKVRPCADVQGADVFVLGSLHADRSLTVDEKLCRMLFFVGAVKDAGAARVTAVVPYLCYGRKDRRTQSGDPVTTRYVAALFESMGADRVVSMDVHNPAAFDNAFRIPVRHLTAAPLLADHLAQHLDGQDVAVASPDPGGVKRAEAFRRVLTARLGREVPLAFVEKHRDEEKLRGDRVVGDVAGRTVIALDDLISSGSTMSRAARACRAGGAVAVLAAATHGLFVGDANQILGGDTIDAFVVTDTVDPFRLADPARSRLTVVSSAPAWVDCIRDLHGR